MPVKVSWIFTWCDDPYRPISPTLSLLNRLPLGNFLRFNDCSTMRLLLVRVCYTHAIYLYSILLIVFKKRGLVVSSSNFAQHHPFLESEWVSLRLETFKVFLDIRFANLVMTSKLTKASVSIAKKNTEKLFAKFDSDVVLYIAIPKVSLHSMNNNLRELNHRDNRNNICSKALLLFFRFLEQFTLKLIFPLIRIFGFEI